MGMVGEGLQNLLAKIVIKVNKRIFATTIGIALCVMYLVGTISMVTGLHQGTERVANLFEEGFLIVYDGQSLSDSGIDTEIIEAVPGEYAACMIVVVDVSGLETRVLSIDDPYDILGGRNVTLLDEVLPGAGLTIGINETKLELITDHVTLTRNITKRYKPYTSTIFPDDWILASGNTLRSLNPDLLDRYSFIVVPRDNVEALNYLKEENLNVITSVGIVEFFELGFYQIEADLWGVILSSAVIIIILVYNIMKIETQYRVPDIKIIKYLGASPWTVLYVFLLQAMFISCLGGLLGLALGIIAANAIVSVTELLGYSSVLIPQVNFMVVGIPVIVTLSAGFIGGIYPAYKASKTKIRTSREVL